MRRTWSTATARRTSPGQHHVVELFSGWTRRARSARRWRQSRRRRGAGGRRRRYRRLVLVVVGVGVRHRQRVQTGTRALPTTSAVTTAVRHRQRVQAGTRALPTAAADADELVHVWTSDGRSRQTVESQTLASLRQCSVWQAWR